MSHITIHCHNGLYRSLLCHGTVKHVEGRDGSLVFDRQVDHDDEVGAVAWITFPNTIADFFSQLLALYLIVLTHFFL